MLRVLWHGWELRGRSIIIAKACRYVCQNVLLSNFLQPSQQPPEGCRAVSELPSQSLVLSFKPRQGLRLSSLSAFHQVFWVKNFGVRILKLRFRIAQSTSPSLRHLRLHTPHLSTLHLTSWPNRFIKRRACPFNFNPCLSVNPEP